MKIASLFALLLFVATAQAETISFEKMDLLDFIDDYDAQISPASAFISSKGLLRMGKNVKMAPTLTLPLESNSKKITLEMGTTTSFCNSHLILMKNDRELFKFIITTPTQMSLPTVPPKKWGGKNSKDFDLAVMGTKSSKDNMAHLSLAWQQVDGSYHYSIKVEQKLRDNKILVDEKGIDSGINERPNLIKIVNHRHDYNSRFILFKSIEVSK